MFKKLLLLFWLLTYSALSCELCGGVSSFANSKITVYIIDDKLEKISVNWTFDSSFSKSLIQAFDKNKNKKFEESEVKEMYLILEKFQKPKFMTSISIDSKELKELNIQNFSARNTNGIVSINFDVIMQYILKDSNVLEIYFLDKQGSLVFLQKLENAKIENLSNFKTKKTNSFKVIRETMSVANILIIEIKK